ncbi:MAG TPA: lysophospholipid acyltransferase family protein [Syntrophales bacterium]|nr:lysophospholipid acyltransferase family protein [Syntrophales bacterium]HRT62959.1 lysophospholipid acyltransferase family protein [Syntrophales bacterium]
MNGSSGWPLRLQYGMGRLFVFLIGPVTYGLIRLAGWRVRDLRGVRRACREQFGKHEGPWLICANHLTLIDSVILAYAMLPLHRYLLNFRWLAWNLPERTNFNRNPLLTALCYLAKCIPVERGGDRETMRKQLEKCATLLGRKQLLMIFPEGGRSRTGRVAVETYSYGVGRFVQQFEKIKILCIYLRGDGQATYSDFPAPGEVFTAEVSVLEPRRTASGGLKAQRDYAEQIIQRLCEMEEKYFADRERHRGSVGSPQQGKEPGSPLHAAGIQAVRKR